VADSRLADKVQTVLGLIEPGELGLTLAHEHIVCDGSCWFVEPEAATDKGWAHSPVSLESLWWIRYHWFQCLDDLVLRDEDLAVRELRRFKLAGGDSVVEMSNHGLGRDPEALARISRATGLNVLMGSGYYLAAGLPPGFETKPEEEITAEIVADIQEGVGPSRIKAGFIGEIGTSWPIDPREEKSLRAAAKAQPLTGAHLNIHPGQGEEAPWACLRIAEQAGADLSRVTLDHIDRAVRDPEKRLELARTGVMIEYDLFGREGYYPRSARFIDLPTDHQRINEIVALVEAGFLKQILISQDIWNKHQLTAFGGWGYDHILRNARPVMRLKGLSEAEIDTILIDNPRRTFTFV